MSVADSEKDIVDKDVETRGGALDLKKLVEIGRKYL